MNAVELKFADGKPTGIWYCSTCREIQNNVSSVGGKPHSESHQRRAEVCCTGKDWMLRCTGCRKHLEMCICGRNKKHLCTGCGSKLFYREGQFVQFGETKREFCNECAKSLQAKLAVRGNKLNTPALTAPDTSLSTLAPKTGAKRGPVTKPDPLTKY